MATFQYIASNAAGKSVRGRMEALDRQALLKKLTEQGLFLTFCKTAEQDHPAQSAPLIQQTPSVPPQVRSPKVPLKELAILTRQISISVQAGMSFVPALQRMAQRAKRPATAQVLRAIVHEVLAGRKFSDALQDHPTVFPPLYISMVASGEVGGFLPDALNRTADLLEKDMDVQRKIRSALVYPALIAFVAAVVVVGMMTFIIPIFIRMFDQMRVPLPLPTRILVAGSQFFRHGGFLLPVVMVGGYFLAVALRNRNESFRRWTDRTALKIPLFGHLITISTMTRFVRTLASLVNNGVMALEAIGTARLVVQNRSIQHVVDELYASVQRGNGLSDILYDNEFVPDLVADMIATGESTGTLPEVLTKTADYYDSEIEATVRDLLALIEPLMIMVMALIVGLIMAGLLLPMITMPSVIG